MIHNGRLASFVVPNFLLGKNSPVQLKCVRLSLFYIFHSSPLGRPLACIACISKNLLCCLYHSKPRRIAVVSSSSKSISCPYSLYDLCISMNPHSASSKDHSIQQPLSSHPTPAAYTRLFQKHLSTIRLVLTALRNRHPPYSSVSGIVDDIKSDTHAYPEKAPLQPSRNDRSSNAVPQSGFPACEYKISASTQLGSIPGTFPIVSRTDLEFRSGSLYNVVLAVMPSNASGPRQLNIVSRGGAQSVRIVGDWVRAGGRRRGRRGWCRNMRARVGRLTWNIRIVGREWLRSRRKVGA